MTCWMTSRASATLRRGAAETAARPGGPEAAERQLSQRMPKCRFCTARLWQWLRGKCPKRRRCVKRRRPGNPWRPEASRSTRNIPNHPETVGRRMALSSATTATRPRPPADEEPTEAGGCEPQRRLSGASLKAICSALIEMWHMERRRQPSVAKAGGLNHMHKCGNCALSSARAVLGAAQSLFRWAQLHGARRAVGMTSRWVNRALMVACPTLERALSRVAAAWRCAAAWQWLRRVAGAGRLRPIQESRVTSALSSATTADLKGGGWIWWVWQCIRGKCRKQRCCAKRRRLGSLGGLRCPEAAEGPPSPRTRKVEGPPPPTRKVGYVKPPGTCGGHPPDAVEATRTAAAPQNARRIVRPTCRRVLSHLVAMARENHVPSMLQPWPPLPPPETGGWATAGLADCCSGIAVLTDVCIDEPIEAGGSELQQPSVRTDMPPSVRKARKDRRLQTAGLAQQCRHEAARRPHAARLAQCFWHEPAATHGTWLAGAGRDRHSAGMQDPWP